MAGNGEVGHLVVLVSRGAEYLGREQILVLILLPVDHFFGPLSHCSRKRGRVLHRKPVQAHVRHLQRQRALEVVSP